VNFKAVTLKVAAVSGDMPPMSPSHADLRLPMPHVEYNAWLVMGMSLLQYSKALTAICIVNTTRDCCLDHKMYACLRLTKEAVAYTCGPELVQTW